ncbi:MAG TPA: hypothetical protein DDY31_17745 [Lachnospiraceae bacterium]|nr:hypothetical protein [Lachnospiraceae bacterium]
MIFTLENILDSLADVLNKGYPEYPVYTSPNQQGTEFPCFFIFFMPSQIDGQIDERFLRDLGIDIVFVQQRNIENGNAEILRIAGYLDEALELFPYADGSGEKAFIHTSERQWKNEDMELHYQFHIKQRVAIPRNVNLMEEMEENSAYVKHGQK